MKQNDNIIDFKKLEKNDVVLTKFLNESEMNETLSLVKNKFVCLTWGGYEFAERVRMQVSKAPLIDENDWGIICIQITTNPKFLHLEHRCILGTLMSLGINRAMIGDIIVSSDGNLAFVFICDIIFEYIKSNFKMINGTAIYLELVDFNKVNSIDVKKAKTMQVIISSLRLDVVLKAVMQNSRNYAVDLIDQGLVFVNHLECLNHHYRVKANDVISVRKFGRIKIIGVIRQTSKKRDCLEVQVWR